MRLVAVGASEAGCRFMGLRSTVWRLRGSSLTAPKRAPTAARRPGSRPERPPHQRRRVVDTDLDLQADGHQAEPGRPCAIRCAHRVDGSRAAKTG